MILRRLLVFVFGVGLALGCTRDDICPEDTPTSPLLIITFKDFADGVSLKEVPALSVLDATDPTITLLGSTTTDSIAIPLRNFSNSTQFLFIRDTNNDNPDEQNADRLAFNYTVKDVYLNRACGFIANYEGIQGQLDDTDTDNWVFSIQSLVETIEDQNETHITILH